MEEMRDRALNQPIELDWEKLLPPGVSDDQPPALVIVKSKTLAGEMDSAPAAMLDHMPDREILDKIERTKKAIPQLGPTLPDKGEKLRSFLNCLEDEMDKRNLRTRTAETIHLEESDEFEKPVQSMRSGNIGGLNDFGRETAKAQDYKDSSFAAIFLQRINRNTEDRKSSAFENEVSLLSRCEQRKLRNDKELSRKRRHGSESRAKQSPPKRHQSFSRQRGKQVLSSDNEKGRASSACFEDIRENSSKFFYKKKNDFLLGSNSRDARPMKVQTIVLVDDEEPKLVETSQLLEKPDESMKDVMIYYPSREHPESVEISYTDFDCLAPQAYLSSNIMNFYIRYLQQNASPSNSVMRNCHFFNTFFYSKLTELLSCEGNRRDEFFTKFRRWWKGVNIFHKEYILIPINEDVHWSLVIICNPDREEQSGPIILHLDSLGLHSSRLVFQNIKSYLQEEWNHLRREASSSDIPFTDHIWKNLRRRIEDYPITVPQQKNDYDCGLFVLYFMERFIEDAPGRLKRKDLAMFGRQWFKPEEASGLRLKIHNLLMEEFKNAQTTTTNTMQSSPPSSPSSLHDVLEV